MEVCNELDWIDTSESIILLQMAIIGSCANLEHQALSREKLEENIGSDMAVKRECDLRTRLLVTVGWRCYLVGHASTFNDGSSEHQT